MLEQVTKSVELSPVDNQGKLFTEAGKELLRYTPSKPMFMALNIQKGEFHKSKGIGCPKSNPKIMKKKRHKEKLKLFKIDKHLWDPAMHIPQLGKSAKYFKKKNKLHANDGQGSGSQISGNEIDRNKTNTILPWHQLKPLEYTFDILCLADNASSAPLLKELQDNYASVGSDLLNRSSSVQDLEHFSKEDATNRSRMKDLIVFETPKPSRPKTCHLDDQIFEPQKGMHDTLNEIVSEQNLTSKLLSSNLLMNIPAIPHNAKREAPQQLVLETKKLFQSPISHFASEIISEPRNDNLDTLENVSPIDSLDLKCKMKLAAADKSMFIHTDGKVECLGFVGIDESEKKSSSEYSTLVQDKGVRDSAEEDSVSVEHDGQLWPNELEISNGISNTKSYGNNVCSLLEMFSFPLLNSPSRAQTKTENQQIIISQRPRQHLIAQLNNDPFPKVVRDNAKVPVRRRAFSLDDAIIASSRSEPLYIVDPGCGLDVGQEGAPGPPHSQVLVSCQMPSIQFKDSSRSYSPSKNRIDDAGRSAKSSCLDCTHLSECSNGPAESITDCGTNNHEDSNSTLPTVSGNQPNTEGESNLVEVTDVNDCNEEHNCDVLENSIELSKGCSYKPYSNEGTKIAHGMGLVLDLTCGNSTPSLHHVTSSLKINSFIIAPVHEILGVKETSEPPSSDSDTTSHISVLPEQGTSVGTEETLGPLLTNSMEDVVDSSSTLPQNISEQTPGMSPSAEEKLSECLDSVKATNLCKLEDVGNEESGMMPEETSTVLGTRLTSLELSDSYVEESKMDRDSELNFNYNSIANPTHSDQSMRESISEDAGSITTLIIATPRGVSSKFDDSYSESSNRDCITPLNHWVLPPGKKFRRSLAIIRNLDERPSANARRGRHYEISVEEIIKLQGNDAEPTTPVQTLRKRLTMRRSSWMRQITPPPVSRSTFIWSPKITDRGTLYETPHPRKSIYSTPLQQNLARRMSVRMSPILAPRRSVRSPYNQNSSSTPPDQYTIRDLILTICKQTEPCSFSDILSDESYEGGCKLGEGVFGEVFSINRDGQNTVLKIIPIEGQQLVNGEKQKTYQEVLSELVIAKVLDEMRYERSNESNLTSGFAELIATSLVQDSYPETLLRFWEEFDQKNGSDNDSPKMFDLEQLFIVMEQGHGGKDLESYTFSSAKQSLSIFKQIAFSLAVAEMSVEFEHRDLHWGNVLVSKTSEKHILYTLNGTQYSVASNGVKCTIIDYTLSRIKYINQFPIYNDIGKDPEMFIATGDYQFDIYRHMKKDVEDDWSRFVPKTNARWLHYLLDKMLTKVKYQRRTAKVHKDSFKLLEEIATWVEDCGSALSIALRLVELKY